MNSDRIEYLRNYLVEKMTEATTSLGANELFIAVNDEATFVWVDLDDAEVVLVTISRAEIKVAPS